MQMTELPPIEAFVSSTGVRIYRIPCEAFPGFIVYCHLLLEAGPPTLVDTGSGYGGSNRQLLAGLEAVRTQFGEAIGLADIRRIIITHGHIDHFGGLSHLLEHVTAEVAVHPLDRRVLTHYEERLIVATKNLRFYLQQAGVPADMQQNLIDIYQFSKQHVRSVTVERELHDGDELDGLRFIHTPGHCPGQVCIGVGDILLSADHILPGISPHQSPESITAFTGLAHYLEALDKVARIGGFDLALGGHEGPTRDVYRRIDAIRAGHERKLDRVSGIIRAAAAPPTVQEITTAMYPKVEGFDVLLALEEAGAHVEYLYQHGRLEVTNLDEVEREDNPPLRYAVAQ
jgi:glyoxylase-like metal-dependent hydrolase (beta-lactamase superfamily II)